MWKRFVDWLFPVRCESYRFHCYHSGFAEWRKRPNPSCRENTVYLAYWRQCCRCGARTKEQTF